MELVEEIYGQGPAKARYEQVRRDLLGYATADMNFPFNPNGTELFSLMELRQAYARRCSNFADAIVSLVELGHVVPSAAMGRALIETIAMGSLFLTEMNRCVDTKNKEKLESRLLRFYAGTSKGEVKPVHVMDAIRHLEEVDAEYLRYLDGKFGTFSLIDKMRAVASNGQQVESHADALSMMRVYDNLSEVVHPNGTGVQYLYPDSRNEDDKVARLRHHLKHLAISSIWQCKHLLTALEATDDLPERYRQGFGVPEDV